MKPRLCRSRLRRIPVGQMSRSMPGRTEPTDVCSNLGGLLISVTGEVCLGQRGDEVAVRCRNVAARLRLIRRARSP